MPSFDQKKAYAEQEEVFFDDGREVELLHYVFGLPELESIRGNPAKVLQAIDKFGREKKYLMNVGEDKGKIVTDLIAEVKPQTMVQYLIKTPVTSCAHESLSATMNANPTPLTPRSSSEAT